MYGHEPATINSDSNFFVSTLLKKGANESFTVTNDFRDILIEPFETIKEEDQVDIDLGESSKYMYFDSLALSIRVFVQDNLDSSCRWSPASLSS